MGEVNSKPRQIRFVLFNEKTKEFVKCENLYYSPKADITIDNWKLFKDFKCQETLCVYSAGFGPYRPEVYKNLFEQEGVEPIDCRKDFQESFDKLSTDFDLRDLKCGISPSYLVNMSYRKSSTLLHEFENLERSQDLVCISDLLDEEKRLRAALKNSSSLYLYFYTRSIVIDLNNLRIQIQEYYSNQRRLENLRDQIYEVKSEVEALIESIVSQVSVAEKDMYKILFIC